MGNVADKVRAASGIQEALIALADGIDDLAGLYATPVPAPAGDAWSSWTMAQDAINEIYPVAVTVAKPARDEAAIADLRARVAAAAGEERLALEAALRLADENGYVIEDSTPEEGNRPVAHESEDSVTFDIPPASAERKATRTAFCQQHKLWDFQTGQVGRLEDEEFTDAYAKGGPAWLYYGDRLGALDLPVGVRQAMIADVEQDSPALALEIGRDLLMYRGPQDQSNTSAMNA